MSLILPRRRFLAGLVGIIAAPAIVRVENIMKVASIQTAAERPLATWQWAELDGWEPAQHVRYIRYLLAKADDLKDAVARAA